VVGAPGGGAVSVSDQHSFRLDLGRGDGRQKARRRLVEDLSAPTGQGGGGGAAAPPQRGKEEDDLASFVQRRQVQTLTAVENLRELLEGPGAIPRYGAGLGPKLQLIAGLIARGFGTRLFYVSLDGFDTHADQAGAHQRLLAELAGGIAGFYETLKTSGHDQRVALMTFSEFGRRVHENGNKGTDHGAASCLFVAGPKVKGGVVGKHPSLSDLEQDDLKFHTDFRRVYATLLDGWLGCDSKAVLGARWDRVPELAPRA
jgi:hypothetical protein